MCSTCNSGEEETQDSSGMEDTHEDKVITMEEDMLTTTTPTPIMVRLESDHHHGGFSGSNIKATKLVVERRILLDGFYFVRLVVWKIQKFWLLVCLRLI